MIRCLTILLLIMAHSCSDHSPSKEAIPFDIQGHRGCRGLMPENTIPAMIKALDLGVTTLEMDVCFTKDDQPILSHEPFFNHDITTRPDGSYIPAEKERDFNLYTMSYDETRQFDVGLKAHPRFPDQQKLIVFKPLLAETIDSVEAYCAANKKSAPFYNIETKTERATDLIYHPEPGVVVDRIMKIIMDKGIAQRVIIQSFDVRTLQYLHTRYPGVPTALLIEKSERSSIGNKIDVLGYIPTIISPEYTMVDRQLITYSHERKMKIIPWTVNERQTIDSLKSMGVDGIITDYPNLLLPGS